MCPVFSDMGALEQFEFFCDTLCWLVPYLRVSIELGYSMFICVTVVMLCYVMLWNELVLGAVMSQSNCKDT